jgi:catechol 2,3-dioxygenase-like lactoylglutathione lyase family enzyme
MAESSIFHVGILVPNLEGAIEHYGRVLGIEFNHIVETPVSLLIDGEKQTVDARLTFSRQGPPYVELIQMHDESFYSGRGVEGLHHIGVWSSDYAATKDRLLSEGLKAEAEVLDGKGNSYVWFNTPESAGGTRFEFVDDSMREALEEWIRTGGQ